jgi:hypothetical protein
VKRVLVGAAVLLALGASGLVCQRVGARGRYATAFSSYGSGPEGTRGLFLLAERLGARPRRWAEDLGRLPPRGMLLALGSCDQLMRRPLSRLERENLKRWVEGGGVLVVAGVDDYARRPDFGVEIVSDPERCRPTEGLVGMLADAEDRGRRRKRPDDEQRRLDQLPSSLRDDPAGTYDELTEEDALPPARIVVGVGDPLLDAPLAGMRRPLRIDVSSTSESVEILRLDGPNGETAGVRARVGEGAVIALSSASMFQNRDLGSEQGGVLFARLVRAEAPDGPILFDEYHLGVGQQRSLARYLRQVGMGAVALQLLLLVAFALWRFGARFGGARADPEPEPAGTVSYVEGVGTLYARASDPSGAARILVRRALERIGAHHHLDGRDAEKLADELDGRRRAAAAAAVRKIAAHLAEGVGRGGLPRFASELDALVLRAVADERRAA